MPCHEVSQCCKPAPGDGTRQGCWGGIQSGRGEALLPGKPPGFILSESQFCKAPFLAFLNFFFFLTPNIRIATSAWLLLIQDTFQMKFIKHLSVKRRGSLYSSDSWKWLILAGWVFREICSSREVQDYFSVHHKEVREVELTQKG